MVNWMRGCRGQSVMKMIHCNGLPEIHAQLTGGVHQCSGLPCICGQLEEGVGQSAMGICAFCYISNLFDVVVFERSMLDWRRGWGQSAMGICALCYIYMSHIWFTGFPEIYS